MLSQAAPPAQAEPVLAAQRERVERSALAAAAAREMQAAERVAKEGVAMLAGGVVPGAAAQVAGPAATEPCAVQSSCPQARGAGNRSAPRPLPSAGQPARARQRRRESVPGDHLRGSGLMASPRIRGEPWRSHALKAPPRRSTGALLAGCAPALPLVRLYGRARPSCQPRRAPSVCSAHLAALRYTTGFSPGSRRPGCAFN
jgi:hypothetical protein